MSRFAVVDKGLLNGYATYLLIVGVFMGASVQSVVHHSYATGVLCALIAISGWYRIQEVYTDIEAMQDDFIENQAAYRTGNECCSRSNDLTGFLRQLRGAT